VEPVYSATQDLERSIAEDHIREFLRALGQNVEREGLKDTPRRVVKAFEEFLRKEDFRLVTFSAKGYDQMIVERGIPFHSLCEHHLLPFFGTVAIGYLPKDKIVGLSKLARTVEHFSRELTTQEYLTEQIADFLFKSLEPLGIGVRVEARHLCQELRGVKKVGGVMITTALRGVFYSKPGVKEEFFDHIGR